MRAWPSNRGRQFERNQRHAGRGFPRLNVSLPVNHHTAVYGAVRHRPVFPGLRLELVENNSPGLVGPVGGQ